MYKTEEGKIRGNYTCQTTIYIYMSYEINEILIKLIFTALYPSTNIDNYSHFLFFPIQQVLFVFMF